MTSVLTLAAVLLAQTPQAPDLGRPITFARPATPVKRLIADLAAQTGVRLEIAATVAADVLFVQVENVPIKEVLDRIAQTVNGEWTTESDGRMRLTRPAGNANREAAQERQERLASLQKVLKRQYDAMAKKPAVKAPAKPSEEPELDPAQFITMNARESKHILALLQRLNLSDLLLDDEDGRVVFSSNPTQMQRLLPGNLEPIVADLVKEHNESAATRRSKPGEEEQDEEAKQWAELMKQFGFERDPQPLEGRPAKMLLIAEQQELFGGLSLSLRLFDGKGKVAIEKNMNLGMQDFVADAVALTKPKATTPGDDPAIEFSPATKELNQIFSSMTQMANRAKLSADLEAKLLRPDQFDPLAFGPSDSLASVAKVRKLNVVALLPDSFSSFMEMFAEQSGTVGAFLRELEESDQVRVTKTDKWLIIQPRRPVFARTHRTDRSALAKLIAAAKAKGLAGLDDIAAYALTSPSPFEGSAAMPYLMLFAPNAMQQGMMGMADWNALRLYGTLGVAQRQTLAAKGRIPLATFAPNQRALLERMLFGARSNLKIQDPNAKPREEMGLMEMIGGMMPGGGGNDYRQEPTEIMPNGIPPQGFLTGSLAKEPVGRAEGNDPMLMFGALSADELAMMRYFKEDPKMAMVAGMMPSIDRLRIGERTNVDLRIFVANDVALERRLVDNQIDPNGPVVSFDNLPAEFRSRIDKRLEAFKKSPIPGFPGAGAPVRPPSPTFR